MIQKFAFTTAAMATALEDTPVSYEDLADIEKEFELVETEISTFTHPPMITKSPNLQDPSTRQSLCLRGTGLAIAWAF